MDDQDFKVIVVPQAQLENRESQADQVPMALQVKLEPKEREA